ncbi:hypothetical protein [Hyphococcus sp.]|uniref:hypothetical protein n=1 Tax=Hyphococcus sp. TaxID=2038636 RepID=UPI00207F16DF|nr:MAG: hypothetical protein DHS20C04_26810 [Marinicaulis sp.]
MGLRILSVVGEALNFGGRRMETIARVAWLPLLLSMTATMAAVFAMLSVIVGRLITFADVPAFFTAQQLVAENAAKGFQNDGAAMWTITVASVVAQTLLTASFMAPLIRYAGLGEKPAPGLIRAPFGADQLRFIVSGIFGFLFIAVLVFGPMAAASFYTMKYIMAAMSQTMASFPDPASLHTIEVKTAGELVAAQGKGWIYDRAMPLYGAAPLALIFWGLLFFHFHPDNRPVSQIKGNPFLRALVTFAAAAAFLLVGYVFLAEAVLNEFRNYASKLGALSALGSYLSVNLDGVLASFDFLMKSPTGRFLFFGVSIFFIVNYLSLRLFAYPGVAVCRRSLTLGNTLAVTRGWNILRLWVIVSLIGLFLYVMQVYVINALLLQNLLPRTFNLLYAATAVSTKLVNGGATADWVLPSFVWFWNMIKILINIVWSFFSFGVAAGLYGRLYRESEAGH